MGLFDGVLDRIAGSIAKRLVADTNRELVANRAYRMGEQREQLKVRFGQFNDNIALNFIGLIENRIVSQMFGGGISFSFGDGMAGETANEQYISAVWDANKQERLLHNAALGAGDVGTGYILLNPGGVFGEDGKEYPRLMVIDPYYVTMQTNPEDWEQVIRYIIEYLFIDNEGKDHARRRIVEHELNEANEGAWWIRDFVNDRGTGGRWELVSEVQWPWEFCPIVHWQNLPAIGTPYGQPDITENLRELQDRVNFVASNISKLIRFYAHPQRFSRKYGTISKAIMGPDDMPNFDDPNGGVFQLEPLGDLASSQSYLKLLRQTMFDTARVVDIDSMQDKIGALTNFGLKVLYQDNLNMIGTKRELMGDALEQINTNLQVMAGMGPVETKIVWPNFLPVNDQEEQAALQGDLNMGIVSKQTAAATRGYDWDAEQERMNAEKANQDNVGGALLANFFAGREAGQ